MPAKLLIYLAEQDKPIAWLHTNADGDIILGPKQTHQLSEVQCPSVNHEVVVIVPSTSILLTSVEMPTTSQARMLQAVPYALEEQLAENVEQLHFAIGASVNKNTAVAVVAQKHMRTWLEALQKAKLPPDSLIPNLLTLPYERGAWTISINANTVLVRTGTQSGFTTDLENLGIFLHAAYHESEQEMPTRFIIKDPEKKFANNILADLDLELATEIDNNPFDPLTNAAKTIQQQPVINLLQGQFKIKRQWQMLQKWRWAIIFAIAWLAVLGLGHITSYLYLKIQRHKLNTQITQSYRRIFPSGPISADPKTAVSAILDKLNQAAAGNKFLNLLAKAGNVIHKSENTNIINLTFENNQLVLKIKANNFSDLQRVTQSMTAQGLKVKQTGAVTEGKFVTAELRIE